MIVDPPVLKFTKGPYKIVEDRHIIDGLGRSVGVCHSHLMGPGAPHPPWDGYIGYEQAKANLKLFAHADQMLARLVCCAEVLDVLAQNARVLGDDAMADQAAAELVCVLKVVWDATS